MIVIDLIILLIIASSLLFGYKKGLVNTAVGAFGFLIALVLSFTLNASLASFLKTTPIYSNLKTTVESTIRSFVENPEENNKNETSSENKIISSFMTEIKNANQDAKEALIAKNTEKITEMILKTISFMIIYILVSLIISVLSTMLNGIFSLPLLDMVNNLGGMGVNGIVTILKLEVVFVIIKLLSPISLIGNLVGIINQTSLTKFLYENNILFELWALLMK